jgi:hypothetical protein
MIGVILQLQYYQSMDSSDLALSDFYVPETLYEDPQVTLYADFRMDIREDQEPDSRPTYIQEILSGKRRLVSMGRLRFPSLSATTLTPVQRPSTRRKPTSTNQVIKISSFNPLQTSSSCQDRKEKPQTQTLNTRTITPSRQTLSLSSHPRALHRLPMRFSGSPIKTPTIPSQRRLAPIWSSSLSVVL